jgi:hypothetical protein
MRPLPLISARRPGVGERRGLVRAAEELFV